MIYRIKADNYSVPFLFLFRRGVRSNPFINFELLAGPIIEFPSYIPIMSEDRYDVLYLNRKKTMLSLQSGIRINFKNKTLKSLGIGFAYLFRFKPAFEFHPVGTDLYLNPKVDEFKFELFYLFSIKKSAI